ncbi:MAG: ester cyclase [Saprospiraceae bacterium]|nr:ester cyclase [Saprospiraceae bacterium]
MNRLKENKAFIIRYYDGINDVIKTPEICDQFIIDTKLKENIMFFDAIFPKFRLYADEMVAEGDKVMVRARFEGVHKGGFNGIPPTHKKVEFPFVIRYIIKNQKIVDHWIIANQMILMEQLDLDSPI